MPQPDPIHLEPASPFVAPEDKRLKIPEPLPVRLISVTDVLLPTPPNLQRRLDNFYVTLLGFERDLSADRIAYRADNFHLFFQIQPDPLPRDAYRTLAIEVQSLAQTEKMLIEAEIEYTRQHGLVPGSESLTLLDPAGNWLQLVQPARLF